MREHHARAAAEIADLLEKTLADYRRGERTEDDVTYVIVKVRG